MSTFFVICLFTFLSYLILCILIDISISRKKVLLFKIIARTYQQYFFFCEITQPFGLCAKPVKRRHQMTKFKNFPRARRVHTEFHHAICCLLKNILFSFYRKETRKFNLSKTILVIPISWRLKQRIPLVDQVVDRSQSAPV